MYNSGISVDEKQLLFALTLKSLKSKETAIFAYPKFTSSIPDF